MITPWPECRQLFPTLRSPCPPHQTHPLLLLRPKAAQLWNEWAWLLRGRRTRLKVVRTLLILESLLIFSFQNLAQTGCTRPRSPRPLENATSNHSNLWRSNVCFQSFTAPSWRRPSLIPSPWSCWWANTRQEKRHLSSTSWEMIFLVWGSVRSQPRIVFPSFPTLHNRPLFLAMLWSWTSDSSFVLWPRWARLIIELLVFKILFCFQFGSALLNRLQCCTQDSPLLQSLTLIDTPGVLAGEKQRLLRGYDYTAVSSEQVKLTLLSHWHPWTQVIEWFAQKVDRILILFDANKLDISDELRRAIWAIRAHDDKVFLFSATFLYTIATLSTSMNNRSGLSWTNATPWGLNSWWGSMALFYGALEKFCTLQR